jgi:hypothetical protein
MRPLRRSALTAGIEECMMGSYGCGRQFGALVQFVTYNMGCWVKGWSLITHKVSPFGRNLFFAIIAAPFLGNWAVIDYPLPFGAIFLFVYIVAPFLGIGSARDYPLPPERNSHYDVIDAGFLGIGAVPDYPNEKSKLF